MDDDSQSRFLMALALSMLVLLMWMRFMGPKREPAAPVEQPGQAVSGPAETVQPPTTDQPPASEPQSVQVLAGAARVDPLPEDISAARDVVVETSLLRATFTTLGGRLRSLELKEYESNDDGRVELVPPTSLTARARLPLGITIPGPNVIDNPDAYLFDATVSDHSVSMECMLDCGLLLRKEFRFKEGVYTVEADITLVNETSEIIYVGQDEQPGYQFGWEPAVEDPASRTGGRFGSVMGPVWMGAEGKYKDKSRKPTEVHVIDGQWAGLKSRYFAAIIRPETVPAVVDGEPVGEKGQRVVISAPSFPLDPGQIRTDRYELFMGPMELSMLLELGHDYSRLVNFGMFRPVSVAMLWIMRTSYRVLPNYGVAIILLTILARVLLYPLNHKSFQSMKKMQALKPAMQEIEQKYKDKPQEKAKKMMALQREHGIGMFGGCLPMLAQFPIWIALFRTLLNAIELRGAPFLFWINDLSAPETIARLPFSLPLLGDQVHLLPLLMAGIMFAQQKMMPTAAGPQADSQKMMLIMMPIMMGVLFYHMPSGLCLYTLVSTLLGIVQQRLVNKGSTAETVPAKIAKREK